MGTATSELLSQLQAAVSGWTTEVGAAQQRLSQQIDGANSQLDRLLAAMHERNGHAATLAAADAEIERLKRALNQGEMPPGTVTNYTADTGPKIESVRKELDATVDRLQAAIQSWTSEVTQSQNGILEQFNAATAQLQRLLQVLGDGPATEAVAGPSPDDLRQVQHERDVLADEVHALNIEVETLRREQENFASANLNAESDREDRHRKEVEALELALTERDSFIDECQTLLEDSQRIESALTDEIAGLERQVAVYKQSEEQLKGTLAQQRQDSEQHLQAIAGLTREMEALRQSLAPENDGGTSTNDVYIPEEAGAELQAALERVADLETALAAHNEAMAGSAQQSTGIADAPAPADSEELDSLRAALAATEAERDALAVQAEERSSLELALSEANETIARLEGERASDVEAANRVADLEAQIEELSTRPTPAEFEEAQDKVQALEKDLAERPTPGDMEALHDQVSQLERLLEEQRTRDSEVVSDAQTLARDLEDASRELAPEAPVDPVVPVLSPADQIALEASLAQLEDELTALKQREEESVSAARVLLQELETHRSYEAAQEASLSEARAEIARIQTQLEDSNRKSREAESALVEAQAETDQLRTSLAEINAATQVNDGPSEEEFSQLQSTVETLQAELAERESRIAELSGAADQARITLEGELTSARRRIEELESQSAPEGDRGTVERQAAELREYRDSQLTAEKWIDDLEKQLAASESALAELRTSHQDLESRYESFSSELQSLRGLQGTPSISLPSEDTSAHVQELEETIATLRHELAGKADQLAALAEKDGDAAGAQDTLVENLKADLAQIEKDLADRDVALAEALQRESELMEERDQLASALHESSAKQAAQEEDLAEAISSLESQQAALQERDEAIEAFRQDVSEMGRQLQALTEREEGAKRQADELKVALDSIQTSDALHVDELEESRKLLEKLRADYEQQRDLAEMLSGQGEELERLVQTAQQDEISALASVEELQTEVKNLQEKEAAENRALEETRAQMAVHQELLQQRETRVAELESQLAEVVAEKETLREATARQEAEMQATMAEVTEALSERDELRVELEKSSGEKSRVYAGEAGMGLGASEAAISLEQRARQQDILVSELTHVEGGRSLGDILADAEVLTREQLAEALDIQAGDPSQLLGTILIEHEFATDDAIAQAVACQLDKPVVNPLEVHIQPQAVALLSRDVCTWHVCVPLRVTEDRLVVSMANPLDESAIFKLRDVSQREITPVVSPATQIMSAIEAHYGTF